MKDTTVTKTAKKPVKKTAPKAAAKIASAAEHIKFARQCRCPQLDVVLEHCLTRYEKAIAAGGTEEEAKGIFFTSVYKGVSPLTLLSPDKKFNVHVVCAVILCLTAPTAFVPVFGPVTTANVESLLVKGDAQ